MEKESIIEDLYVEDDKKAYQALLKLEKMAEESNSLYSYMDEWIKMLDNEKSYIRVRGFRLICKNAKWDKQNKIDKEIDKILSKIEDKKPIVVRQYLAAIKDIVENKKELNEKIKEKLLSFHYLNYKDTMQNLIFKDIEEVLKLIEQNI